VKVDELRVLEADELGMRLRTARRELYELRFKHAVGQLDNSSQISKVRHDLARILTVLRERDLGLGPTIEEAQASASPIAAEVVSSPIVAEVAEPEAVEEAEAPKPKRGRGRKKENAE
jgi:large subunit ribosomal protein L29